MYHINLKRQSKFSFLDLVQDVVIIQLKFITVLNWTLAKSYFDKHLQITDEQGKRKIINETKWGVTLFLLEFMLADIIDNLGFK